MDRIEYIASRIHDHCDEGDEIAARQQQERIAHYQKTQSLLDLARRMVEALEGDLARYARSIPEQTPAPVAARIGAQGRIERIANGESPTPTTEPPRRVSTPR
jgi:hypothetical protein